MITPSHNAQAASSFTEEVKLIPRWSIAAAAVAFVFMQYLSWVILPAHRLRPATAPFGMRFYFALSWSTLAAMYMLMVGYVSRDAPRRNMSTRLWVVICLAMPGGIGSVLYFLLRQPVVALCPRAAPAFTPSFISAPSAPTRCPRLAVIAIAACALPMFTVSTAATAWPRTICLRACALFSPEQ